MTPDRRHFLGLAAGAVLLPAAAACAQEDSYEVKRQRQLATDWPWLGRYAADNAALTASGKSTDIVFMGDSITEGWAGKRPAFFRDGRVGRGISGQTTPQMVLRMMADVIALKPKFVHIMAGTNDIAGNTGPMTPQQTQDNLAMMVMLARAAKIGVLLASVPPADGFPWRPGLATVAPIRALNAWAKDYAGQSGATFVDYTPALATPGGAMKPGFADDGVHPTAAGYAAMEDVLTPILRAKRLPV
ncbi:GDSL family lipase [Sphingomonas sp. Leaf24]|uniref:GDSL-type esterase/lipase family protein n=1 Tax=unclassified Sphingomonas TaxID=196159 RepID=UPI000701D5C4|nr:MULTISPECIES: GDSL-type esterase/lipase family protein [unclassified Sphingomonas]KQM22705.1 GDSL family lipase [Sphingomonas sp. Leaf5]KQM95561.1 GDSL family lipase [Sphingomonas sp. Leaf24]